MKKEVLFFEDAQNMKRLYPATFEAPSEKELNNLNIKDFVKVCVRVPNREEGMPESERFWVEITKIDGDTITGKVSNDLVYIKLKHQELISFHKNNVYSYISEKDEVIKN
ncbi:MAG: DUF2314 domain-containing protein [Micavibrio sp.]|nr:DUF2314 domain-containing protein [Micavibrio sp.]